MVNFTIIGVIYLIPVIVLFIILIQVWRKEEGIPYDNSIIKNFMTQYSHGHSNGILITVIHGKFREGYVFMPKGLDYVRLKKEKKNIEIKPEIIWIGQRIIFPKGELEGERNEIWILPPTPEDYPADFKTTQFGKVLMKQLVKMKSNQTEVEIVREEISRKNYLLQRLGGGEATREEILRMESLSLDTLKAMGKEIPREKPKTSPFSAT